MSGLVAGLCSISFRELDADTLLSLCLDVGLEAVEWGSDVHAPPGAPPEVAALASRCRDAGVRCASYGSYYFAGRTDGEELDALLDTAEALGAKTLRIWAPFGIGPDASAEERRPVTDAVRDAGERADRRGLSIGLEFHPGTLTETALSTLALLEATGPNVFTYWQPRSGAKPADSLDELERVRPRLAHLHVFSWDPTPAERRPLDHLESMWRGALRAAAIDRAFAEPSCAYLEYLPDDDPEALRRDSVTLTRWIEEECP